MAKTVLRNHVFKKPDHMKVLVVDDQAEIRSLVREVLLDAGVTQVFEAQDGKAALRFVDDDVDMVNLIICDWNMPSLTGIEFLRQIRTVYPDLPFLLLTGRCDKDSVVEAKMSGVSAYIRKPFSPNQLEDKLRIMMDAASNHK